MNDIKYLFISILVYDGEMRHDHRVVIMTRAKDINFAAQYYVAHYYGFGKWEYNFFDEIIWLFHGGSIMASIKNVQEITKEEFYRFNELFV